MEIIQGYIEQLKGILSLIFITINIIINTITINTITTNTITTNTITTNTITMNITINDVFSRSKTNECKDGKEKPLLTSS